MMVRACSFAALFLALIATHTGEAAADQFVQEFKTVLSDPAGGTAEIPFHVEVESRCVDGYVVYTLTNKGPDWPKHVFIGITGSSTGALFDNGRIKLQHNQAAVFKADFRGNNPYSLDFVIRPSWVKQELLSRFKHTPPPGWLEAGKQRVIAEAEAAGTAN